MKFQEIVEKLAQFAQVNSLDTNPEYNPDILGVASLDQAVNGTLSYIEGEKFLKMLTQTHASALILPLNESIQQQATEKGIAWIGTKEPRLIFAQAIALFYQPYQPKPEIHSTAIIADSAVIGKNVYIGANVVIQEEVIIGDGVIIHPNVVIYPQVTIGDRTILHANCTIQERARIGKDCMIHSGAVIGGEGFGFVPSTQGWFKMQQSGYVVLEDEVEIGCNSNIDRPAVGITKIGKGTKLDNLVQIGHGCQIGQNCVMAAQVGLAGGVKIGNQVMLGGQVGVANQVIINDRAIATAKSGIHNDVAAGEIVSGSPAITNKLYLKVSAIYKKLPEIYETFKKLK